jgi:hypothetical protein
MIFATFFSYSGSIPRLEREALDIFVSSVRRHYPHDDVIVITDYQSARLLIPRGFRLFPVEIRQETLLLDRVRAYKKLMETYPNERFFGFMDFDMILLKKFDFLDESFDCVYTLRPHLKHQPINGGLAVYKNEKAGLEIISKVIKTFEALSPEEKRWWGDQISISSLLLAENSVVGFGENSLHGGRVLLLDAAVYNWTPHDFDVSLETLSKNFFIDKPLESWMGDEFDSKFIIHFKGPRKHLQYQFWEQQEKAPVLYISELTSIFHHEAPNIIRLGSNYFSDHSKITSSHHMLLDLAVLAILNIFNHPSRLTDRRDTILWIKGYGDARATVLMGQKLGTRLI